MRTRLSLLLAAVVLAASPGLAADQPACADMPASVLAGPASHAAQCRPEPLVASAPNLPGDLAFVNNFRSGTSARGLHTTPLPTLNLTLVGANTGSFYALDFDNSATTLWTIDDDTFQYGTLDQATGAFTAVGTLTGVPGTYTTTGLTFDPTSSNVYLTATDGQGMDFDPSDNTLYGFFYMGGGSNALVTIDLATGAATLVFTGNNVELEGTVHVPTVPAPLVPAALDFDDTAGNDNGVLEPLETAAIQPSWTAADSVAGVTGLGVASGDYTPSDDTADYGDILGGTTVSCTATGDCYEVIADGSRPATHWDVTLEETLLRAGL